MLPTCIALTGVHLASMSRHMAETFPAQFQTAIGHSIGLEMLNATCLPATAPRKRKTNTFANSEIATTLLKDFLGTTISCDMFGYSTKDDHAAARVALWTYYNKACSSGHYMTVFNNAFLLFFRIGVAANSNESLDSCSEPGNSRQNDKETIVRCGVSRSGTPRIKSSCLYFACKKKKGRLKQIERL